MRVNCGCGATPTPAWANFDNSISIVLARHKIVCDLARMFGLIDQPQLEYVKFAKKNNIRHANVVKRIPVPDSSVDVLYSSHMLEHLDDFEARLFLGEARRVLRRGGVLRIAVPDLRALVDVYMQSGDADRFVAATLLAVPKSRGFAGRIKSAIIGARHHHWMYDAESLCALLSRNGFLEPTRVRAGETRIVEPGELNLYERHEESLYVEAIRA